MRKPLPEAFAESMSQVFGKDKVIVTTTAVPSQPIKAWYKDWTPPQGTEAPAAKGNGKANGWLYDQLLRNVQKRIAGQRLASVTFIWMQGEADAGAGWAAVYEKSFFGVLEQIKHDLNIEKINFVIGRINDHWVSSQGIKDGDAIRNLQVSMAEAHAQGAWVDTDDLNTGINPWAIYEVDGGHFPNPAYRVLGQRFARKACKLIDPGAKLDDGFFDAAFFDTVEGIESHLAIAKKISGTKPENGSGGREPELASLLDGKYGRASHDDPNWLVFPPNRAGIELLVDLGEKQSLTGIGVNFLINHEIAAGFPKRMLISASEDGVAYWPVHRKGITVSDKAPKRAHGVSNLKPQSLLMFLETPDKPARYMKIELESGSSQMLLDEIVVNPSKSCRAADSHAR